jgi:hypothetical protein
MNPHNRLGLRPPPSPQVSDEVVLNGDYRIRPTRMGLKTKNLELDRKGHLSLETYERVYAYYPFDITRAHATFEALQAVAIFEARFHFIALHLVNFPQLLAYFLICAF